MALFDTVLIIQPAKVYRKLPSSFECTTCSIRLHVHFCMYALELGLKQGWKEVCTIADLFYTIYLCIFDNK